MKRVQILMSSHNGEKYLRDQLDSYLQLNNAKDVSVLIRDDGSTDGTRAILEEYRDKHGFSVFFGENVGLCASMFELMNHADESCDYFAYSDQDDFWLPEKLSNAVDFLNREDNSIPVMYAACSYLADEKLQKYDVTQAPKAKMSFFNAMIQNVCVGHTVVMNRTMLQGIRERFSKDMHVHDSWSYLYATAFGKVVFDPRPTTLYRQHENNEIGYKNGFFANLKTRIKRLKSKEPQKFIREIYAFYKLYENELPRAYREECNDFFSSQKNLFKKLGYLKRSSVYRQTKTETLIFKFLYLCGKYNPKGV